ncbi:hypothetical protein [Anaeromyxobacter diazotrophicus]|uniref:Uncharacterized protein n=1 Tax=Anaeromyxobacter diazotrophicus TaxID=2590199 RepID=A0A7I9VTH5_9BACT|nr:hypothetical protein [Anaeromyxobacter diazotrophicus]GEJ59429.1 hypothetical protein AMYX_41700 [Anaeromyxobacter diazotrophicus]
MQNLDPDALLAMLRDPNRETQEIAASAGVPRDEAGRAARLALGLGKAKPEEILSLPPPLALALLRAAATAGRADVLAAAAAHPHKDLAKEGKRALYVLKMRGVAVPEAPRPAAPPPAPAVEPPVPCFASTVDGHGERAVWIGRAVPGKGIEVGQAVLSDEKGLVELHLALLGRKEYRQFAKDIVERGRSMGVAETEREQAKGLVAAARRLNDPVAHPPPPGADAWLARLGPAELPPDPAERFPALPEEEERAAVEASGRLHELPLLRGWLADEEALRSLARKLDEIAVSALYLDERQRADAAASALAEAVAALFDPPRRARWSSRLFAVADHLQRAGDPVHAGLAAAAARALRGGAPPDRIPFARLLVEKAFPPGSAAPRPPQPTPAPGAAGPGSLIVPP